ncbi:lytic transglycosylase domain-containing protein [bacterium]|nr:lytic transglycosylase domain-containing protein [bacterium]
MRTRGLTKLLTRSSNILFGFVAVALSASVVHWLYQSPVTTSTEVKIHIGGAIPDAEVPLIAEARAMRRTALAHSVQVESDRDVGRFADRFNIDWDLARLVNSISESENMDPNLIFNVIQVESQFNTRAVGSVGEIGLMQVRPETALTIDPGATVEKLFDPAYNIRIGIKHLKDQLHFFRGDLRLALLAYNRGRGTINSLLSVGLDPSNGYAAKIMSGSM